MYSSPDRARRSPSRPTRGATAGSRRGGRRSGGGRRASPSSARRRSRRRRRRGRPSGRAGGSTSSAPSRRHASSATVEPGGDVGVELRGARARGETARRTPAGEPRCRALRQPAGDEACNAVSARRRSGPAIASRRSAQSASERAIGPAWSRLQASGTIPAIETRPRVGLNADVPQHAEGMRSDPAVSVPVAAGVIRDASAAAGAAARPPGASVRGPTGSRPGRSCRPRRTRACGDGRGAPCPRPKAASRRRSPRSGTSWSRLLEAVSGLPATP